ncbi:MAG: hypothetical protein LBM18_06065 [Oscillospiraceae bacterium]|jgi:hypothetical protein|nr:hypothetical protein [Oscillospiraceae bacterium]
MEQNLILDAVSRLALCYEEYLAVVPERKKGLGNMFHGWFSSGVEEMPPVHRDFLSKVEECVAQLTAAAQEQKSNAPPTVGEGALEAARLILFPAYLPLSDQRALYLVAAQGCCDPLLPYLAPDDLKALRADFERSVKKRERLPVQEKLIKRMRELTGEKK